MVKGPSSLYEIPINLPSASTNVLPVISFKNWEIPYGAGSGGRSAVENRDLSLYDVAPEAKNCSWMQNAERGECLIERQRARQFIYEHWRLKKRGYISVEFSCADCDPIVHYFIEPNENGTWRIASTLEDDRFPLHKWEDAFDVRYRRATAREREAESSSNVLSFLDRSGKEIDSF